MIKTCPVCGKQFESNDMRKVYCSKECARRSRSKFNSKYNIRVAQKKRMEWAKNEAEYIFDLCIDIHEKAKENIFVDDRLADYIYNNYNRRKGNV